MSFRFVLIGIAAAGALVLSGCYNNPRTSLKHPGEGPAHIMSGPAVGPGTTAGGSTAGPQPQRQERGEGHAETPHAAAPAEPAKGHEGAAH